MINIVIIGVGGQGTLLASRILGELAMAANLDVKISEVHGMAQRGGSVVTYVRMCENTDEKVYSPLIENGGADFLLSFERLEALRAISYLKPGGVAIVNTQTIPPMPVITGAEEYPPDVMNRLLSGDAKTIAVDAFSMAEEAGSVRSVNLVLLGVLSGYCRFSESEWLAAISRAVPPKTYAVNEKAFKAGKTVSEK